MASTDHIFFSICGCGGFEQQNLNSFATDSMPRSNRNRKKRNKRSKRNKLVDDTLLGTDELSAAASSSSNDSAATTAKMSNNGTSLKNVTVPSKKKSRI